MTRPLSVAALLATLSLFPGCMRSLNDALCPCVDGFVCCETQGICLPQGSSCASPSATGGAIDSGVVDTSVPDGGAINSAVVDASIPDGGAIDSAVVDASVPSAAHSCTAGPSNAALMCPGGPFAYAQLETQDALLPALVGRWQRCEGDGLPWSPESARDGIEFAEDGTFFLLGKDAGGDLQRVVALHSTGKYVTGTTGNLGLSFQFPEGGGAAIFPSFDQGRAHLHADDYTRNGSNYVRLPVPKQVAPMCPGGPFSFAHEETPSATRQALTGRWQLCEGVGILWGPDNARQGLEFTEDGTFFLLGVSPSGALQRVVGLHSTGKYVMGSTGDLNVYFHFPEGGGAGVFPSFDPQRAHLHAGGDSGNESNYARVAKGEDHAPGADLAAAATPTASCGN